MFSDPFTAVMALILLAFVGTLAVFLRIWRELDSVRSQIREIRENIQLLAIDSAQQNRELVEILRDVRKGYLESANPTNRSEEKGLGELLEEGLPNLMGEAATLPSHMLSMPTIHADDEDLLRRLGGGRGIGLDAERK